jgi:hypothetical protein
MKSLEEAQDWEKLETWMLVVWWSEYDYSDPVPIQDIERATLTLFRQRPSAIPRFEGLLENRTLSLSISIPPLYSTHVRMYSDGYATRREWNSRVWGPS